MAEHQKLIVYASLLSALLILFSVFLLDSARMQRHTILMQTMAMVFCIMGCLLHLAWVVSLAFGAVNGLLAHSLAASTCAVVLSLCAPLRSRPTPTLHEPLLARPV